MVNWTRLSFVAFHSAAVVYIFINDWRGAFLAVIAPIVLKRCYPHD